MAVISISIIESEEQVVMGIPRNISIDTNIPSSIFYTLDGTDPTLFSEMYIGSIKMPTNLLSITLKVFATNGDDSSPIISETYVTNMLGNTRLPHSATDVPAGTNMPGLYPYGTNPIQPLGTYLNPGDASITVDNPDLPEILSGYNADGYPTGFTNQPYNLENYSIRYTTTDFRGQMGPNIGTLPGGVIIPPDVPTPEQTDINSNLFDPRAYVIFQDTSKENPEDPPHINRQFFSMENSERVRDGNNFYNSGLDSPPVTGSFLRSHFNPRDNTITYYYMDSTVNKWIISKTPYTPQEGAAGTNLSGMVLSKNPGSRYVFEWVPFARRVLF